MNSPYPPLHELVSPLLGQPYATYDCWNLVRTLFVQGFDLDLVRDPQTAADQLREIWFRGDPVDPFQILQPWDCFILATRGLISNHLGLIVDKETFVHTRVRCGVCLEPVRRWLPRLVQLGRLRMLM